MRWLVLGASGMLGQDVTSCLRARGEDVRAVGRREVDVTARDQVVAAVRDVDVVVNCAAYTAVDAAETDEAAAFALNAVAPALVARAAHDAGARVVHVSTDYVFDGHATQPYGEGHEIAPASAYGRTKAAGEWAVRAEAPDHLLLRTAWLYGAHGSCFPRTIARAAAERGSLSVVDDQVGQPTWTADVADLLHRLVVAGAPAGTYHATSSGSASWCTFARAVVEAAGMSGEIVAPTSSAAYQRPAPRPAYSVLGHDALVAAGVAPIGDWRDRWQAAAAEVLAAG